MKIFINENYDFTIEDGVSWIKKFLDIDKNNWLSLFSFIPLDKINKQNQKSAILALFQTPLIKLIKVKLK